MAKMLYERGSVPEQDPMFGIRRDLIVSELTAKNWNRHAIVRVRDGQRKYIYIERRKHTKEHGGDWVYRIEVHNLDSKERDWSDPAFSSLKEALAQANAWGQVATDGVTPRGHEITLVSVPRFTQPSSTNGPSKRDIPQTALGWTVEEVLRDMRAYEPFAALGDDELLGMLEENPMLHCEILSELSLTNMLKKASHE